jgi:hypothetical protein
MSYILTKLTKMELDPLYFLLYPFLPLLKYWKYKCNDVTFSESNYLIYILKFFKIILPLILNTIREELLFRLIDNPIYLYYMYIKFSMNL